MPPRGRRPLLQDDCRMAAAVNLLVKLAVVLQDRPRKHQRKEKRVLGEFFLGVYWMVILTFLWIKSIFKNTKLRKYRERWNCCNNRSSRRWRFITRSPTVRMEKVTASVCV